MAEPVELRLLRQARSLWPEKSSGVLTPSELRTRANRRAIWRRHVDRLFGETPPGFLSAYKAPPPPAERD